MTPQLMIGKVMHGRLFPRRNNFTYGIYYLALPLGRLKDMPLPYNRFAPLSFYDRDHGACDGSPPDHWARSILRDHDIIAADGEIMLICMPRVFGYVFNPVSFWLCHDKNGALRAVLCEVNNTFGERHTYLCAHPDHTPILHSDELRAEKLFHVSPMLKREGHYEFRFDIRQGKFGVWIDFFDASDKKQLVTCLAGKMVPMTKSALRSVFWAYPLVTFKAIALIHWQAAKLLAKGIKYIAKPDQKDRKISASGNLGKM